MQVFLEGTFTLRRKKGTGRQPQHQTLLNCQLTPRLHFFEQFQLNLIQTKSRSNSEKNSFQKHHPEGNNLINTVPEHTESHSSPLYCPLTVSQSRSLRKDIGTGTICNTFPEYSPKPPNTCLRSPEPAVVSIFLIVCRRLLLPSMN